MYHKIKLISSEYGMCTSIIIFYIYLYHMLLITHAKKYVQVILIEIEKINDWHDIINQKLALHL